MVESKKSTKEAIERFLAYTEPYSVIIFLFAFFSFIGTLSNKDTLQIACMTAGFASIFAYITNFHNRKQLKFELFKRRMEFIEKVGDTFHGVIMYQRTLAKIDLEKADVENLEKYIESLNKCFKYHFIFEIICLYKNMNIGNLYNAFLQSAQLILDAGRESLETKKGIGKEITEKNAKDFTEAYHNLLLEITAETKLF